MGKAAAEARYSAVLHPCDTTAADCWQSPLGLQVLRTVQRLSGATRGRQRGVADGKSLLERSLWLIWSQCELASRFWVPKPRGKCMALL
jgi:hypothetical protein